MLEETAREEFWFVLPDSQTRAVEWMACLKALEMLDARPAFVCASGSLPPGAPDVFYARVAEIVGNWGVKFALDTSGPALGSALGERIHLIKPNLAEMRELAGAALDDERSAIETCRSLIRQGRVEIVALTLGAEGALLVTADTTWRASALPIRPVSSVGAGDSFLGAMVWALASKMSLEDAFRYGAAALQVPGTELGSADEVRRLAGQVGVERIDEPKTPVRSKLEKETEL